MTAPDRDGYCPHGQYVGGMGIDRMCGRCEAGEPSTLDDMPLIAARERYLDAGGDPHYLIGLLCGAIRAQWTEQQAAAHLDSIGDWPAGS